MLPEVSHTMRSFARIFEPPSKRRGSLTRTWYAPSSSTCSPSLPFPTKLSLLKKTCYTEISLECTASARRPNLPSRIILPRGHPRREHHQRFRQLRQGDFHRALGFRSHESGHCNSSEGTGPGCGQALQQEQRQLSEGHQPRSEGRGCLICRLRVSA